MFQKEVLSTQALGSAGEISNPQGGMNLTPSIVADDKVGLGSFVQWKNTATNENEVFGASGEPFTAATEKLIGVAVKDKLVNATNDPHFIFKVGDNVNVITSGRVLIETETACKKGQYVFLQDANGALAFDDTPTKAGHTYTGWRVLTGTGAAVNAGVGHDVIEITTAL